MAQPNPSSSEPSEPPHGDPWHAFGYLVSGVLFYGGIGWVLDRWLDTRFLVIIGILIGAALGIYLTFARFGGLTRRHPGTRPDEHDPDDKQS
jgi:ATP synthase protein I